MTFKIGDRVRRTHGQNDSTPVGFEGVIRSIRNDREGDREYHFDNDRWGYADWGGAKWESAFKIEAGKFYKTRDGEKAGPVTLPGAKATYDFVAGVGTQQRVYGANGIHGSKHISNVPGLDIVAEWVEPFQIEAGKFYKTRDGRRVGPAKDRSYNFFDLGDEFPECHYPNGRYHISKETPHDIVAEWPLLIEEGKTYLSDTGAKVGPMVRTHERHDEIYFVNQQIGRWRLDGAATSDSRPDLGNLVSEWVEPLKIEAGKYYRTADGRVFGPYGQPEGKIIMVGGDYSTCRFLGGSIYADCRPHKDNLVEEVPAPAPVGPIREVTETVTRTEIVPGVYGRVEVRGENYHNQHGSNGVGLAFVSRHGQAVTVAALNADELDAAADVFKRLAEALRNA